LRRNKRRLTLTRALAGVAVAGLLAGPAAAQGVPIVDGRNLGERLRVFLNLEEDRDTQVEKANKRADMQDFENAQIETLDRMIEAFGSLSTFQTTFVGGGADMPDMETVYGPLANPAGRVMFGDAKENIEELIIRGARDTYGHAGVSAAGLSPMQWRALLQALIWQESRFRVGAKSPANAYGLTQIIPGTAQQLGIYPAYYEDPYLQVTGGGRYLAQQLERFDGNIIHALAAYNAGPGRVIQYDGVPPFKETQHYVQVIPAKYNSYLARMGGEEAQGTIDPAEYAVASASLMSHGSIHYAEHSLATAQQALRRVRALVAQIGESSTVKESYDLNTMMRAEIILILNERIKMKAARSAAENAEMMAVLTAQREAFAFLDFVQPEF